MLLRLTNQLQWIKLDQITKKIAFSVVGSVILAISAKIIIPLYPVNVTLQTLALVFIAVSMSPFWAGVTVAMYLFEGIMGLPVFSHSGQYGAGIAYMSGPSAGYLLGYLPATYLMSMLYQKGYSEKISSICAAIGLTNALITLPGLLWISYLFGLDMTKAHFIALLPGSCLKTAIAALMLFQLQQYKKHKKTF